MNVKVKSELKKPLAIFSAIVVIISLVAAADAGKPQQLASVDVLRVVYESKQGKEGNKKVEDMKSAMNAQLEQWSSAPLLTKEEWVDVHKSFDDNPAADSKAKASGLLTTAQARAKRYNELAVKKDTTDAEKAELNELNDKVVLTRGNLEQLNQELSGRLQEAANTLKKAVLDQVKASIADVSKNKYDVVFTSDVVPFSANDITDLVLADMNKK